MLPAHDGMTVDKFDELMLSALSVLPGVKVYDGVRPDEDRDGNMYVVYFPGDLIPGAAARHEPITGFKEASVLHPFAVMIAAPTARARRQLQAAVRRVILGFEVQGASGIRETGQLNSYGVTDATLIPVRYTQYMTYQVTVDRSA